MKTFAWILVFCVSTLCTAPDLQAQNSSLFQRPVAYQGQQTEQLPAPASPNQQQLTPPIPGMIGLVPGGANGWMQSQAADANHLGLQTSWAYVPPTPSRSLKLHDIVSIRVEEISNTLSLGNTTSRKTTSYDAVLKDWIRLVGLDTVKPAPQSDGDPRVQTIQNEVYRGDSTMRTSESMTFNIGAEIVDIKPNGLIVLNATKTIENQDNISKYSLTGTCRSQDIDPNNVVLSRNLIHSHINKQDSGHVRDGYSRGWLTKFLAWAKPF